MQLLHKSWLGLAPAVCSKIVICLSCEVREERLSDQHRHPRHLTPTEEQAEEGDPGEEAGEEGGQDSVRHPAGLHTHLDSIQRVGSDEGHPRAHSERQNHPGDDVVHRLLSLLHQLNHQPLLLCSV